VPRRCASYFCTFCCCLIVRPGCCCGEHALVRARRGRTLRPRTCVLARAHTLPGAVPVQSGRIASAALSMLPNVAPRSDADVGKPRKALRCAALRRPLLRDPTVACSAAAAHSRTHSLTSAAPLSCTAVLPSARCRRRPSQTLFIGQPPPERNVHVLRRLLCAACCTSRCTSAGALNAEPMPPPAVHRNDRRRFAHCDDCTATHAAHCRRRRTLQPC
jgi:hypothetical protein